MNNFNNFNNRKNPIVLFSSIDWEITLREALFSIFILSIFMVLGVFISGCIKSHVHNKTLIYRQAAQIKNNPTEFKWAMDTDVGNVFVEGKLKSISSVTHQKLGINVLLYNAKFQHHNMHTRRVRRTRTDRKGRSHSYWTTETYWSWDTYKTENNAVKKVDFSGVEFDRTKFNLNSYELRKVVDNGFRDRIVYEYIPCELNGTFFGEIKNKTFQSQVVLIDTTIEKLYDDYISSNLDNIFWIIWIILSVAVTFVFYIHENNWLEN
jgi:hypothetical protein